MLLQITIMFSDSCRLQSDFHLINSPKKYIDKHNMIPFLYRTSVGLVYINVYIMSNAHNMVSLLQRKEVSF